MARAASLIQGCEKKKIINMMREYDSVSESITF